MCRGRAPPAPRNHRYLRIDEFRYLRIDEFKHAAFNTASFPRRASASFHPQLLQAPKSDRLWPRKKNMEIDHADDEEHHRVQDVRVTIPHPPAARWSSTIRSPAVAVAGMHTPVLLVSTYPGSALSRMEAVRDIIVQVDQLE